MEQTYEPFGASGNERNNDRDAQAILAAIGRCEWSWISLVLRHFATICPDEIPSGSGTVDRDRMASDLFHTALNLLGSEHDPELARKARELAACLWQLKKQKNINRKVTPFQRWRD